MSTAEFARGEGCRDGIADTYDECASVTRAWLANPENAPADLAALFAQRALTERTLGSLQDKPKPPPDNSWLTS